MYVLRLTKEELESLIDKVSVYRATFPPEKAEVDRNLLERLKKLDVEPVRNEYYQKLNERFDKRVEELRSKGYSYYKEFVCFAKSEMAARNHNGINNATIMHSDDYHFNNLLK